MSISTNYPAAAPFLRERALYTAYALDTVRTQRDRAAKRAQLYAYVHALEIVVSAYPDEPADVAEPAPPVSGLRNLADFLKNEDKLRQLFPTVADQAVELLARHTKEVNA